MRSTAKISKYVDVEIEVGDVLASLTEDQIRELCDERGIELFDPDDDVFKIRSDDLQLVRDRLIRGEVEDALLLLERLLPRDFSFLSHDVARFYGARLP